MIEVRLEKVPGGYLLNGVFPLRDGLDSPEAREAVKVVARRWADDIDQRIADKIYAEFRNR